MGYWGLLNSTGQYTSLLGTQVLNPTGDLELMEEDAVGVFMGLLVPGKGNPGDI